MAILADASFNMADGDRGLLMAWLGILAYAFQIYFDFSGYSDMAIGLGHVFGFHFLENFNYPYISRSVTEFWRRWHISLSTWFRDYVYIPLGGNRVSTAKWLRNIFIVWTLTGLWHGAAWNFVFWGLFFGVLLVIERFFLLNIIRRVPPLGYVYTMISVLVGWVLFRSESLSQVKKFPQGHAGLSRHQLLQLPGPEQSDLPAAVHDSGSHRFNPLAENGSRCPGSLALPETPARRGLRFPVCPVGPVSGQRKLQSLHLLSLLVEIILDDAIFFVDQFLDEEVFDDGFDILLFSTF